MKGDDNLSVSLRFKLQAYAAVPLWHLHDVLKSFQV